LSWFCFSMIPTPLFLSISNIKRNRTKKATRRQSSVAFFYFLS
jgi:hypothetical protein